MEITSLENTLKQQRFYRKSTYSLKIVRDSMQYSDVKKA